MGQISSSTFCIRLVDCCKSLYARRLASANGSAQPPSLDDSPAWAIELQNKLGYKKRLVCSIGESKLDRGEAEKIIREVLGQDAERVLRLVAFGLDPAQFVQAALEKAALELANAKSAGARHKFAEAKQNPQKAKRGRPARHQASAPPSEQKCFRVRSTATELLDPLQTAIFLAAGTTPSAKIQRQFAEADRKAKRDIQAVGLIIKQTENLRFADIVRGIVRGESEQDEQAFAAVRPKSSSNPSAGKVNVLELQILQCLAILKHQFTRPAVSKPSCPYIIHKASSSLLGRGSVALVQDADEKMRSALQRWGLWTHLRRHAHACSSSQDAINTVLVSFSRRRAN